MALGTSNPHLLPPTVLVTPLQKSYVYFEVGTANKSTSMDKEDLASPFWSDTVTFDDVPADLAEESIKVQLWPD